MLLVIVTAPEFTPAKGVNTHSYYHSTHRGFSLTGEQSRRLPWDIKNLTPWLDGPMRSLPKSGPWDT